MTTVNVYLNFDGQCEEAFLFYKSVFGGEFPYFSRFKDMPKEDNSPEVATEEGNRIMHVTLPISAETCLMGSDISSVYSPEHMVGNNCSVSINVDSKAEAEKLHNGLSADGTIIMALQTTFWATSFGMFTDKFGINWIVNFEEETQ